MCCVRRRGEATWHQSVAWATLVRRLVACRYASATLMTPLVESRRLEATLMTTVSVLPTRPGRPARPRPASRRHASACRLRVTEWHNHSLSRERATTRCAGSPAVLPCRENDFLRSLLSSSSFVFLFHLLSFHPLLSLSRSRVLATSSAVPSFPPSLSSWLPFPSFPMATAAWSATAKHTDAHVLHETHIYCSNQI